MPWADRGRIALWRDTCHALEDGEDGACIYGFRYDATPPSARAAAAITRSSRRRVPVISAMGVKESAGSIFSSAQSAAACGLLGHPRYPVITRE